MAKKAKEEKRKSLKYSILLLLLLLIFLIVSTYAWFTSNQTVSVRTLNVNVVAQNGLQISANGTDWKTVLQTSDIHPDTIANYASNLNQIPTSIQPVSTDGSVNASGQLNLFLGEVSETANATGENALVSTLETDAQGTDGNYIAFDIFLRVNQETQIYLGERSSVTANEDDDRGLQNGARVAFIDEGNTADGSELSTIQSLTRATAGREYVKIWEPNYDVHTAAGVANARDTYGITTTQTGGSLLSYDGIKSAFEEGDNVTLRTANATDNEEFFATVTPDITTTQANATAQDLMTLQEGITKVRVYMWIEGQDVDCENNASGTDINFDLEITRVAP